jgi:UDP-N-acetylmuramoyl-tripeptide--D-alanyl-D-alanine ligase
MLFFLILFWLIWMAVSVYDLLFLLKYFQLDEYDPARFIRFLGKKWKIGLRFMEGVSACLILGLFVLLPDRLSLIIPLILAVGSMAVSFWLINKNQKTKVNKLVFTARLNRLAFLGLCWFLLASFVVFYPVFFSTFHAVTMDVYIRGMVFLLIFGMLTPIGIVVVNYALYPYEEISRQYYLHSARKIMDQVNPTVIGITGSYGKTTSKEILAQILSQHYEVLRTPKSYNTLMGICKVIREELKPHHQIFVVEMGAYKPGEIKNICALVHPGYGLLTAIGPQHLERFKKIENVIRAKGELIDSLPASGTAVINADDVNCMQLAETTDKRVLRYGISNQSTSDIYAEEIRVTSEGTEFTLVDKQANEKYTVRTHLLGQHNVLNMLGAILIARENGISVKQSIQAISTILPPPHRLNTARENGITYIDDSYNSNPVGARMALEVLGSFPANGRKILVTPGFVELGEMQDAEHENLGKNAGQICDVIILVGSETRISQIKKGVLSTEFNREMVFRFDTLFDVKQFLGSFVNTGDVILFENDLPDNYV